MKTYSIRLQKYDDLLTIQDKITWSNTARVILVFPDRSRIIRDRKDFVLIQRFSKEKGYLIAVVIKDSELREEAQRSGLVVFRTIDEAQKGGWKKPYNPNLELKMDQIAFDVKPHFANRKKMPDKTANKGQLILAAVLVGLALLLVMVFLIPGSQVELNPARRELNLGLTLAASPNYRLVDSGKILPARIETAQITREDTLVTSGETQVPAEYAQGEVSITNLSKDAVEIPAGTVVMSTADPTKRYKVTDAVTLDGGNSTGMTARVKSIERGEKFNADIGTIDAIEGQIGLNVKVSNDSPITGGQNIKVKSASQADYDQLKQKIMDELSKEAVNEIDSRLKNGEEMVGKTVKTGQIIKEQKKPEVGQPAETITMTMEVGFNAWVINLDDLNTAAAAGLKSNIPDGYEAVQGTLKLTPIGVPTMTDQDISWRVNASQELRPAINPGEVSQVLAGKNVLQVGQVLKNRYILQSDPVIHNFPEWWPIMPLFYSRIDVKVQ